MVVPYLPVLSTWAALFAPHSLCQAVSLPTTLPGWRVGKHDILVRVIIIPILSARRPGGGIFLGFSIADENMSRIDVIMVDTVIVGNTAGAYGEVVCSYPAPLLA